MPDILDIPEMVGVRLGDYFGAWAMQEQYADGVLEVVRGMDWSAHLAEFAAMPDRPEGLAYVSRITPEGAAVLQLSGMMMKSESSLTDSVSTIRLRRTLRALGANPDVRSVLMVIDSPGGTVAGTADLGEEVAALATQKPVIAFVEDLGASAAYWIASQATSIYANPTALVGSIGVLLAVREGAVAEAMRGYRVSVFKTGEYKGAGVEGTDLTEAQRSEFQARVDTFYGFFKEAVSRGRGMSAEQVAAVADGRVFIASEAQELGLIDGVRSYGTVLQEAISAAMRSQQREAAHVSRQDTIQEEAQPMSEENTQEAPKVASLDELRAACTGASPEFLLGQIESNATLHDAMSAWITQQEADKAALSQEIEDLKAQSERPGNDAVGNGGSEGAEAEADPVGKWNALVDAQLAQGKSRHEATRVIARTNPELRGAYIEAVNAQRDNDRR